MNGQPSTEKVVIAEGRVAGIWLDPATAKVTWLDVPEHDGPKPVRVTYKNLDSGHYVVVYDHRLDVGAALSRGRHGFNKAFAASVPCLGSFRRKGRTLYIVLADIGTKDIRDGGESEKFVLGYAGEFDHESHRVMANGAAIHPATGICLLEPRPVTAEIG